MFINNERLCECHFAWQEGYGAFTYNRSQLDDIYNYVKTRNSIMLMRHSEKNILIC